MRRVAGVLIACACILFAGGCSEPPSNNAGQQQADVNFDELLKADKVVMTTKAASDLPKTWTYKAPEVTEKVQKLVAVLKEGQPVATGAKTVPMVIFILDVEGGKKNVNVFEDDTFEYGGRSFKLANAGERTYSAFEVLEKSTAK
ncbi:MAG: hypothetical protein WCC10_15520 [Tumebacillaceae bacterium]